MRTSPESILMSGTRHAVRPSDLIRKSRTHTPSWFSRSTRVARPHFSAGFVARRRRRAWMQGPRRMGPAGVLDHMVEYACGERNAVDMPGSTAAVEGRVE